MTKQLALMLLIITGCIFGIIIFVACFKYITNKNYNKKSRFGYEATKGSTKVTGIKLIDDIIRYCPEFMSNIIEKTNLAKANRVDTQTGAQLTLQQTLDRYPEEKIRLSCYLKCLQKFGKSRVELEFPIQVGAKKCFADVVCFHCEPGNPKQSKDHTVLNLSYIFECKKAHANPNNRVGPEKKPETMEYILASGYNQLKSYMFVSPNLVERNVKTANGKIVKKLNGLGCLTNGTRTKFYKKVIDESGNIKIVEASKPEWY